MLVRFEGTLWRDGDHNPSVVVGGIEQKGDLYSGEVTLKGLYPNRALADSSNWKLQPQTGLILRVTLAQKAGNIFAFEGRMNVERTKLLFVKRKGDFYEFIRSMGLGMPQDAVNFIVEGNNGVQPPKDRMTIDEMRDWVKALNDAGFKMSATDGFGVPLEIQL